MHVSLSEPSQFEFFGWCIFLQRVTPLHNCVYLKRGEVLVGVGGPLARWDDAVGTVAVDLIWSCQQLVVFS